MRVGIPQTPALRDDVSDTRRRARVAARTLRASRFFVLAGLVVFFGLTAPGFLTHVTLFNVLTATSLFLLLALGETFMIVSGAIDLSVGSKISLSGVAAAVYMSGRFQSGATGADTIVGGIILAVVVGAVGGLLNGAIVGYLGLNSLIVTLASYGAFLGFADLISNGFPVGNLPPALLELGNGTVFGVPYVVLIAAAAVWGCSWLANSTRFGRYTFAIGANREAVRRAGVDLRRHTVLLFMLAGALAGLTGLLSTSKFESASSQAGSTDLLTAIASVVIGGTPLSGGEGTIWGTVLGALIITIVENGFVLMGVSGFWQLVVVAVIIVIAVYVDEYQRKLQIAAAARSE